MPPVQVHALLRSVHIAAGVAGLVVFWAPLLLRKGGAAHRAWGRAFAVCAWVVILTALVACAWLLVDPVGFAGSEAAATAAGRWRLAFFGVLLGALGIFTLPALVLSVRVITMRSDAARLVRPWVRALADMPALAGLGLLGFALCWWRDEGPTALGGVTAVLGLVGIRATVDLRRFLADPFPCPTSWLTRHMEFTLTCGIAFHTAFSVFGLTRLFPRLSSGPLQIVAWLLPAALGIPVMGLWIRAVRRVPAGSRPADGA